MEIIRLILVVALLATAAGLVVQFVAAAPGRILEVGAALFALATWIAPALLLALSRNRKPKSSLAGVGFTIRIFVVAACLSAVGLPLALLTLIFAQGGSWAWLALVAITAFWLCGVVVIYLGGRRRAPPAA